MRRVLAAAIVASPFVAVLVFLAAIGALLHVLLFIALMVAGIAGGVACIWICCVVGDAYRWAWRTVRGVD